MSNKLTPDKKSTNRRILALALPAIVNNVTVPLLGLCDTAIAGHLGSASFIGAMAVGAMMLNVIYWLCGFLRMGSSGLTARAFGARDFQAMRVVLRRALIIGTVISLAVIIFQRPLLRLMLLVISPEPEVIKLASSYFLIGVWASPAQLGIMALSGWFIGRQNTVIPMLVSVGVNLVNIALSLILVFVFKLGFQGIALGTLCAAWSGFFAILILAYRALASFRLDSRNINSSLLPEHSEFAWKSFFNVSSDLFFRSAVIMSVSMTMTSVTARLGDVSLACNAVLMQFFLFFSYFMDGFAFAAEAMVGSASGARDATALKRCVTMLMKWATAMSVVFFFIYLFLSGPITSALTDSLSVRHAVADMHIWVILLPPVTVWAFILDGVFIGMTRTRPLLLTTLIASVPFFGVVFGLGFTGKLPSAGLLWSVFEIYLLLRGILLVCKYRKIKTNLLYL